MKLISPRNLAIILSALIAGITGSITILFLDLKPEHILELFLIYTLGIFIIFYIIIFYSINRFILDRLRPIYKTVHNSNLTESKINEQLENEDIISTANKDVEKWAKNKAREISQLRQLEKYRKEFLGNVSHELKTPIFNIQGYISTLMDGGINDPTINMKYLERTETSINRLINIVNDLESISMMESSDFKLKFKDFDLIKLTKEVFELHESNAQEQDIRLQILHHDLGKIMVHANREKIFEAMSNLIGNSIKYGKRGGTTIVHFHDMDNHYLIEVEDNGIGIPEQDILRIFERFYRSDKSRSREMGGTGLGLAIVKHIIEAHNQSIHCKSSLGKGSSFLFTLVKCP
jgi:two-component system, OmpR family, phosphate regulon sensor histidine kinase PhoR